MKKIFSLLFASIFLFCNSVFAENLENATSIEDAQVSVSPLTSDKFTIFIDILPHKGVILPSNLKFDIKTEESLPISSGEAMLEKNEALKIEIPVPQYQIGSIFFITMTEGAESLVYYADTFYSGEPFLAETYAYRDENENLIISDSIHISVSPHLEPWDITAERFVRENNFDSKT